MSREGHPNLRPVDECAAYNKLGRMPCNRKRVTSSASLVTKSVTSLGLNLSRMAKEGNGGRVVPLSRKKPVSKTPVAIWLPRENDFDGVVRSSHQGSQQKVSGAISPCPPAC